MPIHIYINNPKLNKMTFLEILAGHYEFSTNIIGTETSDQSQIELVLTFDSIDESSKYISALIKKLGEIISKIAEFVKQEENILRN